MRHSIKSLAVLLPIFAAAPAYAATGNWYTGLNGDLTWLHGDMGAGGNAALGYRFNNFRAEGELGYHDVSSTHYFTYMGNLYYDFNRVFSSSGSDTRVVPYIGAGLGDATVHFPGNGGNNVFAYQGMAGIAFTTASLPDTDWVVGYRYVRTNETEGTRLNANNLELGLRFHF